MRAFIVDDEPKVCQLIRKIVDWDKLGIRLVGEALNGKEALEGIENSGAEIIITDIKMPGMSGIELISRLKEKDEFLSFIVISGYGEFSYAQNALRLGVVDYILKPINKKELEDTLKRIKEQRLEADFGNKFYRLRQSYVENMIKSPSNVYSLEEVNKEYSYKFSEGYFQGFVIKLDVLEPLEETVMNSIAQHIEIAFAEYLDPICSDWEVLRKDYFFYGINGFPEENLGQVQMAYQDIYEQLARYQKELGIPLVITIGIGEKKNRIDMLSKSIRMGKNGMERKLISGAGNVYFGREETSLMNVVEMLKTWNRQSNQAIERHNPAGLIDTIEIFAGEAETRKAEGWEVYKLAIGAGERYINLLKGKGVLASRLEEIEGEFILQLYNADSLKALWQVLTKLVTDTIRDITNASDSEVSYQIRQTQRYIYQNYGQNITLDHVGERIGLNSSYFSTLFKKEVGVGFLEYLTDIRMEEAKILLTTTNDTVVSIASQVGYSDVKHFNRIFKRNSALKPNEYRKLHS